MMDILQATKSQGPLLLFQQKSLEITPLQNIPLQARTTLITSMNYPRLCPLFLQYFVLALFWKAVLTLCAISLSQRGP